MAFIPANFLWITGLRYLSQESLFVSREFSDMMSDYTVKLVGQYSKFGEPLPDDWVPFPALYYEAHPSVVHRGCQKCEAGCCESRMQPSLSVQLTVKIFVL